MVVFSCWGGGKHLSHPMLGLVHRRFCVFFLSFFPKSFFSSFEKEFHSCKPVCHVSQARLASDANHLYTVLILRSTGYYFRKYQTRFAPPPAPQIDF